MKRILSQFLMMMGALMFTLAVYQSNQYMLTSVLVGPSLEQVESLAEASGASAAEIASAKSSILGTTNALLQSIVLDFILGVVFVLAGYFAYPKEAHH